jgi:hypothetical protein
VMIDRLPQGLRAKLPPAQEGAVGLAPAA